MGEEIGGEGKNVYLCGVFGSIPYYINIERQKRYVIEGDIWAIDEGGTATRGVGGLVGAGACVAGLCGCGGFDSDTDYGVRREGGRAHVVAGMWIGTGLRVAEECDGDISRPFSEWFPVAPVSGVQPEDVLQLLSSRIAFPEEQEQRAIGA